MSAPSTHAPLRALTPREHEIVKGLVSVAALDPVIFHKLICELVVSRDVLYIIRKQRRCLPRHCIQALDGLPHRRATSVEYART